LKYFYKRLLCSLMKTSKQLKERFGWSEIILSMLAKTLLNLNYKFHYVYEPFLLEDFGLNLQQWGVIQTTNELVMVIGAAVAFLLSKYPPYRVTPFFILLTVVPSILMPLASSVFSSISAFYWILANRIIFGIGMSISNVLIWGVVGNFTSERVRGRAMGATEFSWTLADYLMPLAGFLLEDSSVWVVYYSQAGAGIIVALLLYWRYPTWSVSNDSVETYPFPVDTCLEESKPLIGGVKKRKTKLSFVDTIKNRKVVGVCVWAVLATAFLLSIAFFGIWLRGDYGFNSAQVGLAFFFAFTIPETCTFLYMSFLSDYIGLLRSAYFATFCFASVGLLFGIFCHRLKLAYTILLFAITVFNVEVMFVSTLAYATTNGVSDDPALMSSILYTSFGIGKSIWVATGPTIWKSVGKIIERQPGILLNQYGAFCIVTLIFMSSAVISMEIGQQSTCRKRY